MVTKVEAKSEQSADVTARSGLTGEENTRTLPMSKSRIMRGLADHAAGKRIQDVFPNISNDDREFLMTGITPEEWDAAFNDDDDDDDEW